MEQLRGTVFNHIEEDTNNISNTINYQLTMNLYTAQ